MEVSRRLINVVGATAWILVVVPGSLAVTVPLFIEARNASVQAEVAASADREARAELAELVRQDARVAELRADLNRLRTQIAAQADLRDASALASNAAKASGARIVAITFAEREVFAAPTGLGMGDDGTPNAPQAPVEPNTLHLQIPVTFEVEVSSTAQAAAFLAGLRSGPRMVRVVQAQASPTNDAKLFTLTVDALIFSARD
jgi:hypothetical protein